MSLAPAGLRALLADPAFRRSFGYYITFICLGLDLGVTGPTLPALAGQTGATIASMGLLFLAGSIGSVVGTAISGRVFERLPGHVVLGAAQLAAAALIAIMPVTPWFPLLVAVVALKGAASGFINTGANTLLVWTHRDKSGPYMNALHFFFGVGAFAAPLLVAQLTGTTGGYRVAYWALAAFAAVVGLRVLAMGGSPAPVHGGAEGTATAAGATRARRAPWAFVLAACLFLFFYVGAEISFGGWVYTYALSLKLATEAGAAYLNSAFWFSFTVGRLISIPAATLFKPARLIPVVVVGCLAFLVLVLLLPGSSAALWIAAIGLGFCMAPVWPTGFTLAGQSIDLSGRVSGLILLGDSVGGMVLPSAIGKVIERTGPSAMVTLIFASLVANLASLAAMLRLRPRPLPRADA
jgi:MFS transporter, FHS family, Na+ dependent glucose transporter 1